jgi:hypothetical protein
MDRLHASSICEHFKAAALATVAAVLVSSIAYAQDTTAGLAGQKPPVTGPAKKTITLDPGPRVLIPAQGVTVAEPQTKTPSGTKTVTKDGTGVSKVAEGLQPLSVARPGVGSKVVIDGNTTTNVTTDQTKVIKDEPLPNPPTPQGTDTPPAAPKDNTSMVRSDTPIARTDTRTDTPLNVTNAPAGQPPASKPPTESYPGREPEAITRTPVPDAGTTTKKRQDVPSAEEMRRRADQNSLLPPRGENENHVFAIAPAENRTNEAAMVRDKIGRLTAFVAQQKLQPFAPREILMCPIPEAVEDLEDAQARFNKAREDQSRALEAEQRGQAAHKRYEGAIARMVAANRVLDGGKASSTKKEEARAARDAATADIRTEYNNWREYQRQKAALREAVIEANRQVATAEIDLAAAKARQAHGKPAQPADDAENTEPDDSDPPADEESAEPEAEESKDDTKSDCEPVKEAPAKEARVNTNGVKLIHQSPVTRTLDEYGNRFLYHEDGSFTILYPNGEQTWHSGDGKSRKKVTPTHTIVRVYGDKGYELIEDRKTGTIEVRNVNGQGGYRIDPGGKVTPLPAGEYPSDRFLPAGSSPVK